MNKKLIRQIQKALHPGLLADAFWREMNKLNPMAGHCYVASEAYAHLSGEKCKPCYIVMKVKVPMAVKCARPIHAERNFFKRVTHWFLKSESGEIIDITATQFPRRPPYSQAKGCGFLTKQPSKRAQAVIDLIGEA